MPSLFTTTPFEIPPPLMPVPKKKKKLPPSLVSLGRKKSLPQQGRFGNFRKNSLPHPPIFEKFVALPFLSRRLVKPEEEHSC
jgi:hypothetical protein